MEQNLQKVLTEASKNLLYPSESDYPFEYVEWDLSDSNPLTEQQVRKYIDHQGDVPIKEQSLDNFFGPVTEVKDWYGEEEKLAVEQYRTLRTKLEQMLTDLHVFKIGAIEADVYIIGKSPSGKWVGLQTKVVET